MKRAFFYETPLGSVGIAESEGCITNVFFEGTVAPDSYITEETPLIAQAASQLKEYFSGERTRFDLPLAPEGTRFEKEVWQELERIPFGQTCSYADIAERIGRPKACRAVGRANGLNPLAIIVPCHRVIGKSGKLTGYAGGLDAKKLLLELETK